MSVKLILKNSKVQFKNATSSQLDNAELAINFHESGPYLQAKGEDGTVHAIGGVYIADGAPSNPLPGRWWYDSSSDALFLYDGTNWQSIGSSGGGGGGSTIVIGADGIKATTSGNTVTVSVDLAADSNGLSIASGKLKADLATESSAGTVIVGDGLSVDGLGVLSADNESLNPLAGRALTYDAATDPDTLNADIATASALGVVKVGDGIDVNAAGEISVSFPPSETYIGETPPDNPAEGDLWWNSSDDSGRLYVYYEDANSNQWVEASPQGEPLTEGEADGLYLSKVSNDTCAGAIQFDSLTTHEAGVSVTGGNVVQSSPGGSFIASTSGVNLGAVAYTGTQQRHNGRFVSYADYTSANFGPLYEFYQTNAAVSRQFAVGLAGGSPYVFTDGNNPTSDPSTISLGISPPVNFDQLTEHAGGVKVSGGDSSSVDTGIIEYTTDGLGLVAGGIRTVNVTNGSMYVIGSKQNLTVDELGISSQQTIENLASPSRAYRAYDATTTPVGNWWSKISLYYASDLNNSFSSAFTAGFHSNLSNVTTNASGGIRTQYNFFAEGTAPNHMRGYLVQGPYLGWDGTPGKLQPWVDTWVTDGTHDCTLINAGATLSVYNPTQNYSFALIATNLRGANASHLLFKRGGNIEGAIRSNNGSVSYTTDSSGTPAFVELGDARNRTFTAFTGNAADTVKLLQPKANGFNPAELQTVVSNAVTGTQDETEAIGTLADYDGTVLETSVTEPDDLTYTEEVETDGVATMVTRTKTWTATGTQPIYQGVDQTKLIPLLTKALQEVLAKNEDLEARIAALEGA